MVKPIHRVTTVIKETRDIAPGVRLLRLSDPDGWDLPPFSPGAHIHIHLPDGLVRPYSLCGDAADRSSYFIAVQKEPDGRGGSRQVHALQQGERILVSLPKNLLPLTNAPHVILIAGGIGITPFMPMIHEMSRQGRTFELHYASRQSDAAFLPELEALCAGRMTRYDAERGQRLRLDDVISAIDATGHLYCCGPERMIGELLAKTGHMRDRVHVEYFGVSADVGQQAYKIRLARSSRTVPVKQGQTMLEALRAADVDVSASCEGGICLECKTRYLEGTPVHRDITMPKSERDTHLTPCVSGCAGASITLDL